MEKAIKRYSPIFVLPTLLAFTIGFIIPFLEGLCLYDLFLYDMDYLHLLLVYAILYCVFLILVLRAMAYLK